MSLGSVLTSIIVLESAFDDDGKLVLTQETRTTLDELRYELTTSRLHASDHISDGPSGFLISQLNRLLTCCVTNFTSWPRSWLKHGRGFLS